MKRICKLMIFMIFRMINGLFIVLIWIVQNVKNIALTQTVMNSASNFMTQFEKVSVSKAAVETSSSDRRLSTIIDHFRLISIRRKFSLKRIQKQLCFINNCFIGKSQILFWATKKELWPNIFRNIFKNSENDEYFKYRCVQLQ